MRRPAQTCQVPGCGADLTNLRSYFVRQHICEEHARADAVPDGRGGLMRFCQQCTKLEPVSAFEGLKRSCEASLQKRHLRRSGGGATGRSKSSSSSMPALSLGAFGYGMGSAPLALPPLPLPPPLPPPLPAPGTAAGAAAAAAIAAALGGGTMSRADDRGSPSSSASLQGRSSSAVAGSNPALAALLEAAADPEAAGLVSIADLPPLASNTKNESSTAPPLGLRQLGGPGSLAGLGLSLRGPAAGHNSSYGTSGFAAWQPPPTWPQPPSSSTHGNSSALASLQAVLAGASGASASAADTCFTLQTNPSGVSSKATVDQSMMTVGPVGGAASQRGQGPDVQQLASALQVLQQLQDAIGSLVAAQTRQQPAPQPTAQHLSAQQQLLAMLAGAGLPGGQPLAQPPPPPPKPQLPDESSALLQLLTHLTRQSGGAAGRKLAAPVHSLSGSSTGGAALQELESQLRRAAGGGGEPDEQQLHALLTRLAARLQP